MGNRLLAALAVIVFQDTAHGWWAHVFPLSGAGQTFWQDTAGPDTPRGGNRLALNGRIFLANGNTLQIGLTQYSSLGSTFTHSPARQPHPFRAPAPLATGKPLNPLVLWGNWRSRNNGNSWEPLPFPSDRFLVYGVGEGGLCLGGGKGESIERSLDSGRTWRPAYKGGDSGYVRHLQIGDSAWAFAALHPARILVSRDKGATWTPWPHAPQFTGDGFRIQAMTITWGRMSEEGVLSSPHLWTLHADSRTGKSRLLRSLIDSGRTLEMTAGLPESTLTSLSSNGYTVVVGGGSRVFQATSGGVFLPAGDLATLPKDEEVMELHGSGYNGDTFLLTRKALFVAYYETGVIRGTNRSAISGPARPHRMLSWRVDGDFTGTYRADGRVYTPASFKGAGFVAEPLPGPFP